MGPHSFKCGKKELGWVASSRHQLLQWGRTLSSAESRVGRLSCGAQARRLQWGRTLSSAERAPRVILRLMSYEASMGPHSFKCGKRQTWMQPHSLPLAMLQWGRTLSSAERKIVSPMSPFADTRFNGAALFQVRKVATRRSIAAGRRRLQWGRTLSSAERVPIIPPFYFHSHSLQWGRTLSSAERSFSISLFWRF